MAYWQLEERLAGKPGLEVHRNSMNSKFIALTQKSYLDIHTDLEVFHLIEWKYKYFSMKKKIFEIPVVKIKISVLFH